MPFHSSILFSVVILAGLILTSCSKEDNEVQQMQNYLNVQGPLPGEYFNAESAWLFSQKATSDSIFEHSLTFTSQIFQEDCEPNNQIDSMLISWSVLDRNESLIAGDYFTGTTSPESFSLVYYLKTSGNNVVNNAGGALNIYSVDHANNQVRGRISINDLYDSTKIVSGDFRVNYCR